jgi:hypothetical protein
MTTDTADTASDLGDTAPDTAATDDMAGEEGTEAAPPVLAQLRPYLPTRYFAASLCSGSAALTRRGWEWVTASGGKTARGRLAGLGLAVYVAGYEELHGQTWILPVVCGAWVVGALVHSPAAPAPAGKVDEHQDEDDELADEEEGDTAEAPAPPVDVDLVACLAHELATADDSANRNAVQLDHLLTHLPMVSKTQLVTALTDAGVPIKEGVKYRLGEGRQRVRQGVRLEDLPTGAGDAPPAPAAGLRAVPSPAGAEGAAAGAATLSPPPTPDPALRAG